MARKLRVQFPGALYHVTSKSTRRKGVFRTDKDRTMFLQILGEACEKTGWQVHAVCLLPDHFQLVMETPRANLVEGMKWFLGAYTIKFNRRHQALGALFSGRYKALFVDGTGNEYFKTACDFVHTSPARDGLIKRTQRLSAYGWSSYPQYLAGKKNRWPWLQVDRLLAAYGVKKDDPSGRKSFEKQVENLRAGKEPAEFKGLRRGWVMGSKAFRQDLLKRMKAGAASKADGETQLSAEQRANRIVREELKKLGWRETILKKQLKGDPDKVKIALRLRRETTMTLSWIADRLKMGVPTHVAHLLYWAGREK